MGIFSKYMEKCVHLRSPRSPDVKKTSKIAKNRVNAYLHVRSPLYTFCVKILMCVHPHHKKSERITKLKKLIKFFF